MASFNLPFTLSAEDAALFKSLQTSAILPDLAHPGRGELVEVFKHKKREENRAIVAPYADILETELTKILNKRKGSILEQLRESKDTSFTVPLFSWNTVYYTETLSALRAREAVMSSDEFREHAEAQSQRWKTIANEGWETKFGVECAAVYGYGEDHETDWVYPNMKVDRIFRNSDLAMRLSLKLGPNFFPTIKWELLHEDHHSRDGFMAYKKTLCVRYYPFGVSENQLKRLLAVVKSEASRIAEGEKTHLRPGEYGVGHKLLEILPEPEAVQGPVTLLGGARAGGGGATHSCFCGCEDSSE